MAAATVAQDSEIVVIGSQAILGQFPDAPAPLLMSREADVYPKNHPEKAADIDAALGDGSQFDQTFGYYAHGVGPETAKAPAGWEERLVEVRVVARTRHQTAATGWCLEAHDLVLSKCAAGRERDWEFGEDALRYGLVSADELLTRSAGLPISASDREYMLGILRATIARIAES